MATVISVSALQMEGFRSYRDRTTLRFNDSGLHVISGENGEGKSTIINAFVWVLYGVNIHGKSIATWPYCRTPDWIGTRVSVELRTGDFKYRIYRHLKYKGETHGVVGEDKLMVFRKEKGLDDWEMETAYLYKKDQQQFINGLLGVDSNTFLQSIVFGQRLQRLMSTKDKDKRELFDTLFDLSFLEEAKVRTLDAYNRYSRLVGDSKAKLSTHMAELAVYEKQYEEDQLTLNNFKEQRRQRLELLKTRYTEAKDRLRGLKEEEAKMRDVVASIEDGKQEATAMDAIEALRNTRQDLREKVQDISSRIADYGREAARIKTTISELEQQYELVDVVCPTCGGPLKEENIIQVQQGIMEKIERHNQSVQALNEKRADFKPALDEYQDRLEAVESELSVAMESYESDKKSRQDGKSLLAKYNDLKSDVRVTEAEIISIHKQHADEKGRPLPNSNIERIRTALAEVKSAIEETQATLLKQEDLLRRVEWWNKKGFGSGGLKAYVFSAMLSTFNRYVEKYAVHFGYSIKFWVDMKKANKPFVTSIYSNGHELDYDDLSGGQKQRVDICTAFALHDMVSHKTRVRLLLLDEVTESLDVAGQQMIFDLLRVKSETSGVYVLNHSVFVDMTNVERIEIRGGKSGASVIS